MQTIPWRRGDTFSWGTASPFSLPAGTWTAVASLVDMQSPRSSPADFGIVVTIVDGGVDPADATRRLFDMGMMAASTVTATWPVAGQSGTYVSLVGVVTFTNDAGERISTEPFTLRSRP